MDTSTFAAFIIWLASSGSLGVVATKVTQLIKKRWPSVEDLKAKIVAILVAAALSIGATLLVPHLGKLPPWVNQVWVVLVMIVSQLEYARIKAKSNDPE